jgi:Putative transposase/Transposase zinc-binding domain
MCECVKNKEVCDLHPERRFRLSEFFDTNWEKYISDVNVRVSVGQFRAVSAMRACRTATLGVDHYLCRECGEEVEILHNCKNRFCPTCSWGDTVKWASKIHGQMMNIPHRHVVFTLPHAWIPLIKSNGKTLLNNLLRTAADTFKDWVEHKYNVKIGIISVLHTFGETKEYHPHVHMIVSWGGLDKQTNLLKEIKGKYVNYKFLQDKFRIKFEDVLVELYDSGLLQHKFSDRIAMLKFLKSINKNNWAIHLEPPMPAPSAVVRYIGRYSKRACLSERKITQIDGEYISFRYKDYKVIGPDNKPIERI